MSEPGWTPGPWTFEPPWSGFSQITGPNGELIFGIAAGGPEEKRPDDECTANARLIAAAPDLYEALRRLLASVDVGNATTHDPGCGCCVHEASFALAKARGDFPGFSDAQVKAGLTVPATKGER